MPVGGVGGGGGGGPSGGGGAPKGAPSGGGGAPKGGPKGAGGGPSGANKGGPKNAGGPGGPNKGASGAGKPTSSPASKPAVDSMGRTAAERIGGGTIGETARDNAKQNALTASKQLATTTGELRQSLESGKGGPDAASKAGKTSVPSLTNDNSAPTPKETPSDRTVADRVAGVGQSVLEKALDQTAAGVVKDAAKLPGAYADAGAQWNNAAQAAGAAWDNPTADNIANAAGQTGMAAGQTAQAVVDTVAVANDVVQKARIGAIAAPPGWNNAASTMVFASDYTKMVEAWNSGDNSWGGWAKTGFATIATGGSLLGAADPSGTWGRVGAGVSWGASVLRDAF